MDAGQPPAPANNYVSVIAEGTPGLPLCWRPFLAYSLAALESDFSGVEQPQICMLSQLDNKGRCLSSKKLAKSLPERGKCRLLLTPATFDGLVLPIHPCKYPIQELV